MLMLPAGFTPIVIIALIGIVWWHNLRAREIAVARGRRACRAHDVQFLDDTVALERYGMRRDGCGRLRLARTYRFDFSAPEQERGRAWVAMLGTRVESVVFERAEGSLDYDPEGD
ncbi:MAG: DUF3301 domain-containing protein [Ectothiorhodospiraceae bacterium]|jgi:hypothetical protein